MKKPKYFVIEEVEANEILNYLFSRPMCEVERFVNTLRHVVSVEKFLSENSDGEKNNGEVKDDDERTEES